MYISCIFNVYNWENKIEKVLTTSLLINFELMLHNIGIDEIFIELNIFNKSY